MMIFVFSLTPFGKEDTFNLKSLIDYALKNNYEIKAKIREIEGISNEPFIVKTLPDPEFSFEMMNIKFDGSSSQILNRGLNFSLSQRFINLEKRNYLKKDKEIDVEIEMKNLDILKEKVIFEVKESYFELYYLEGILKLLNQEKEVLLNSIEVSRKKYESGSGILPDILKGLIEVEEIKKREIETEALKKIYIEKLKSVIGFEEKNFEIAFDELDPPSLPMYEDVSNLIENSPTVNYLKKKLIKADNFITVSKLEQKPEFVYKATYRYNDMAMGGKDYFSLMAGVTIPLFNKKRKYDKIVDEAISLKVSSRNELQNGILDIKYEFQKNYEEAKRAEETFKIINNGILPQMESLLETSLASYSTDKADFQYYIDSLLKYFLYKEEALRQNVNFFIAISKIDEIFGKNIKEVSNEKNS